MFLDAFLSKYPYTDFHELNLDFLLKNYKFLLDSLVKIDNWIDEHQVEYEQLKKYIDDINNGNFTPQLEYALKKWITVNVPEIIGNMIKTVFFEITDDGYFIAYIPDSWSDIVFNTTGLDIIIPGFDYGHLVLTY